MVDLKKIFTVTELTFAIKKLLEPQFTAIRVKGEVTNMRRQSSGHYYFSLKDNGALLSAVLFKGNAKSLTAPPKEGDQVIVTGELSLYAPRGGYQIIVREVELAGIGELLLQLQKLKEKLKGKGWFDVNRKKTLPKYPKTIGVVTSPTGSVIQDILHILTRRVSGFHLILCPTRVQGREAAGEISAAIETFNHYELADLLIVGRGGGSLQDLWPFNEEVVARAVHNSEIPIISAVGHETDFTLCDFVADVRAPTPSAAAEIACTETRGQLQFLQDCRSQMESTLLQTLKHLKSSLKALRGNPYYRSPYLLLGPHMQKMDEYSAKMKENMAHFLREKRWRVESLSKELKSAGPAQWLASHREKLSKFSALISPNFLLENVARKRENLEKLVSHMESIDPRNLLTKGYCIPFAENSRSVIISSKELKKGQKMHLLFKDGRVLSRALDIQPE